MLTQYKNKNTFSTKGPSSTLRFSDVELELLRKNVTVLPKTIPGFDSVELHMYSNDTWITGNHSVKLSSQDPQYKFDIVKELHKLQLTTGKFRFVVNFFKNLIGSYNQQYLYIDDVSPDRTELRLGLVPTIDAAGKKQYLDYAAIYDRIPQTGIPEYTQYVLNFSRNKTFAYVNSVVIEDYLYIRLLDPLPSDIRINFKCWLVEEIKLPYTDLISLLPKPIEKPKPVDLNSPNWQANVSSINISSGTDLKNWNDLLGSDTSTSQQLIDNYFSGSLAGIDLNIDFRDFNNYIFYSSAEERIHNFKFKLDLLDFYSSKITELTPITGTAALDDIATYTTNKNSLIGGFDSFENYLYFESSSILTTYDNPLIKPTVESITGSYVFPTPKSNSTAPFTRYATNSNQFKSWYNNLIATASLYDSLNLNKLTNYLPDAIKYNENNDQAIVFVNMLGHHYDILHTYIKHASLIYKHEENPKLGAPNELLHNVAKQFGWDLIDGNNRQSLWEYVFGTDEQGNPKVGNNTVGDPAVSGKKVTYAIWRRIVNNLPLLLKSKGTKRSIQALISCYGIPSSLLSVQEFGGATNNTPSVLTREISNSSLDLINNTTGNVTVNFKQPIGAVELRFFVDDVVNNPSVPSSMNLIIISGSEVGVKIDFTQGTYGTATIYDHNLNSATTNEIELFDGNWTSMLINKNGSNLNLYLNKSKYGKIINTVSASITSAIPTIGTVKLGVSSSGTNRLLGGLQELRLWTSSLSLTEFNDHTLAAGAYNGVYDSYEELVFRLPLNEKINHAATSSLTGIQPLSSSISASFNNWSSNTPYAYNDETYYYNNIQLGPNFYNSSKIYIDDTDTTSLVLDPNRSVLDDTVNSPNSADSNRIGVFYSPQNMINDDIISHLGYLDLNSYIGDPTEIGDTQYNSLVKFSNIYWKKYSDKALLNDFIRMFSLYDQSLFTQLKKLLPGSAQTLTGILIQPNILERNRYNHQPSLSRQYDDLQTEITRDDETIISADQYSVNYTALFPEICKIQSEVSDVYNLDLTGSDESRYNGTTYVRNYINKSGSTYINDITPYWMSYGVIDMISNDNIVTPYTAGSVRRLYDGCKMTSKDFNIRSNDTYDNGPVVELFIIKGNQLVINKNAIPNVDSGVAKDTSIIIDPNAQSS